MKVAHIAPTWYPIPPQKYGGIERVVHNLTEELVKRGYDITLFASRDSRTSGHLAPSLYDSPQDVWRKGRNDYLYTVAEAVRRQDEFDLLHFHAGIDIAPHLFARYCHRPHVFTYHNHNVALLEYYEKFKSLPVVSISNDCRKMFPEGTNFIATVYNGTAADKYEVTTGGKKFAFLGAISHDKGTSDAVQIAKAGDWELDIAAKLDPANTDYFNEKVKPLLSNKIRFIGEVDLAGKNTLLGGARALLFPINWEEPFGLVMIEAMACGTPVIAYNRGSVSEVVEDGVSGIVVPAGDVKAAIAAAKKIQEMPEAEYQAMRKAARARVEALFTVEKMTDGYEAVYKKLVQKQPHRPWYKFHWQ